MTDRDCLSESALLDFVDGKLTDAPLQAVESHVASCELCMHLVAELSADLVGTEEAPAPDLRDDLRDDARPLAAGTLIGRYKILHVVGEGAMGRVYAAHDPALDRIVALKLLHARIATPELEARLEREAKAMARLSHPEVLTVHDAGKQGDRLFIAMELVHGGSLREWQRAKARGWRQVIDVYARAGRGLAQAHAAGLVHRDFKPDNVLIGDDGRVRVTDFGLARSEQAHETGEGSDAPIDEAAVVVVDIGGAVAERTLTRTGALLGTPAYMAPEQLAGRPADVRSDVYAFAVSLWEALYGDRPFIGRNLPDLARFKREELVKVSTRPTEVPEAVRDVLRRAIRADPELRFPTMGALLDALALAIDPPAAPPDIRTRKSPRFVAAIAGSLALAVTIGLFARRHPQPIAAPATISSSAPLLAAACSPKRCSAEHGGAPWVCRPTDHACVPIASVDCHASMEPGDADHDDTVWLGAMFPQTGPKATDYGRMNAEGTEFARHEFASATRGLQSAGSVRRVPRIALVMCDDEAMPARAAKHLVEDLGVPAILGFGTGQTLVELAASELIPHEVLVMASLTSSPLATRVPQPATLPRLVWRTSYDANGLADAAAVFVSDYFAKLPGASHPTQVVVARDARQLSVSMADELSRALVLDGVPALQSPDRFREMTLPDEAPSQAELAPLARRLVEARPSVVFASTSWSTASLFEAIERAWPSGAPRPVYILLGASTERLTGFIGSSADRRRRVFSITTPTREPAAVRFIARFNADRTDRVSPFFNPGASYDAFYAIAYAIAALDDAPVRGPSIASALSRFRPDGRTVEVGPLGVFSAFAALDAGLSIDLVGASGTLAFEPSTGHTQVDFALACAGLAKAGAPPTEEESGLVVRSRTRSLDGNFHCP